MKNLQQAIIEEQLYIADRVNGIQTSFPDRVKKHGYESLEEYFKEKREYLFSQWKPEVHYIDIKLFAEEVEAAIQNKEYGIYIPTADSLYAYHGTDSIDYDLCRELGVHVVELHYAGGTIIGNSEDLGVEIVAPREIGLDSRHILNKFYEIISKYNDNTTIEGNDILVNGEKVLGSMSRDDNGVFVWAAQTSFGEHSDIIERVCHKKSSKKPGRIKSEKFTRNLLESEVLKWLQKR